MWEAKKHALAGSLEFGGIRATGKNTRGDASNILDTANATTATALAALAGAIYGEVGRTSDALGHRGRRATVS